MDQKIKIDQIIKTQRRSISLTIDQQGKLIVRAPLGIPDHYIESFVVEKRKWILAKQEEFRSRETRQNLRYQTGETFLYLGKKYPLQVVDEQIEPFKFSEGFYLRRSSLKEAPALFEKWYRAQAQDWILKRLVFYTQRYGFQYNQVRFKNTRSRWGSCSSKQNLNYNFRLILAPPDVIDYVVVHELVHLVHKNHSKNFWQAVAKILPRYKMQREWLKINGSRLVF